MIFTGLSSSVRKRIVVESIHEYYGHKNTEYDKVVVLLYPKGSMNTNLLSPTQTLQENNSFSFIHRVL